MLDVPKIREALLACLNDLTEKPTPRMLLITRSDGPEIFRLYKLEPNEEVSGQFRNALFQKVGPISGASDEAFKHYLSSHKATDNLFIEANTIAAFVTLMNAIDQQPNIKPPVNANEIGRLWGYAIEIDNPNGRVIYFRRFTGDKLIAQANEKGKWAAKVSEGRLTYLDGNILTFDGGVDFIYFEMLDGIIVPPPYLHFELMFTFIATYQKESRKVIDALTKRGFLVLKDNKIIEEAMKKPGLVKKITQLAMDGFFDRIASGEIDVWFFDTNQKELPNKVTYSIENEKVIASDYKALKSFVDVCDFKYLKAIAPNKKGEKPRVFEVEDKDLLS